jgi:ADP-ribose pyrophosphatase YjhB (NUDIX family)
MEQEITELFLYSPKLKFGEIEKKLDVRSNKLAYHLKKLIRKSILTKNRDAYALAESAEPLIPYISEKKAALPVILIHIGNEKEALLVKRTKRPYQNLLSLPAGRLLIGETISQATQRIMKEKYNINCKLSCLHSLSLEHVKHGNTLLHSFLLIFVSAATKEKIPFVSIRASKKQCISSDYLLLTRHLKKTMKIQKIISGT